MGIAASQYLGFRCVALVFIVSKYRQERCSYGRCSRNILDLAGSFGEEGKNGVEA